MVSHFSTLEQNKVREYTPIPKLNRMKAKKAIGRRSIKWVERCSSGFRF